MKVIVFGATGAIGTSLVEYLSQTHEDWQILAATRSLEAPPSRLAQKELSNVTMVEGNSLNKDAVLEITKGCDMIYSCIGFPKYERKYWAKHWPIVVDNLLAATVQHESKLIFCDNIYAYGPATNISPKSTVVSASDKSKPSIRAKLRKRFQEHMRQHPGTLTVIGAADFFGPHITQTTFMGDTLTGKIVAGESPLVLFTACKVHDFAYGPDFAKALAIASVKPAAYDSFWIAPHSVHGKSMQTICNDVATAAGQPSPAKASVLPLFVVYLLSPFVGFMWELLEMKRFWTNDYTVDDSDFIREFQLEATPYEQALQETVDFYKVKLADEKN